MERAPSRAVDRGVTQSATSLQAELRRGHTISAKRHSHWR